MDKLVVPTVLLLVATGWASLAQAQHTSYYYKPATREPTPRGEQVEKDRNGYTRTERNRYTYTPIRRDAHRYSPYRYRAAVRYLSPAGHRAGIWWGVGNRLPPGYLAPAYSIDFRRYRLPPPPAGYRWVRVENDVYLAASASGQIRDALYQLFY